MSRHIVIGDIHGCYHELQALLQLVGATDDDIIVSVGDLVDRGPDSPAVLKYFQERCAQGRAVVLMGNHERKHVRQVFSYSQEITRLQFAEKYAAAVEWMKNLPYSYETPECIIVHAALLPGTALSAQKEEILAGTTSGEKELEATLGGKRWHELYAGPKPVAFGHHVVGHVPMVQRDLIYGLDTGACHGGQLTALVLPEFKLYSVPSRADYWEIEKRKWQQAVLQSKPWLDLGFAKAHRELERYADDCSATTQAIANWLTAVADLHAKCQKQVCADAVRIEAQHGKDGFAAAVESYPHKALLHLAQRGRLDLAAVQNRCPTPRKTLDLALLLGLTSTAAAPPF